MPEYVSEEGLKKLKDELHTLKTSKRQEVAARLEHAKSLGDLSENAEYHEAKEEQSLIESNIGELEEKIRNAIVIKKKHQTDVVDIGSKVRVKSKYGEESYVIVGSEESNPQKGKISNKSPLGKSFLGCRPGEKVSVEIPSGKIVYEILEIT